MAKECETSRMEGVMPKEGYGQLVTEEEPELLSRIVRVFKDIPEDISFGVKKFLPLLVVRVVCSCWLPV